MVVLRIPVSLVTLHFFLFSGFLFARIDGSKTIKVKDITMEKEYVKGLWGILINLSLDQPFEMEEDLIVTYMLNEKDLKRDLIKLWTHDSLSRIQIFFPLQQLFNQAGRQKASFSLKGIFREEGEIPLALEGKMEHEIEVDVPVMNTIKIKVDHVAVSKTNEKGNAWDYHLFSTRESDNYPDIIYTIEVEYNELGRGGMHTVLYSSHRQNDTLEASWTYFSEPVKYCEGDKLKVCIKDGDTVFHDKIGCIALDKLKARRNISELTFDSVLKFSAVLLTK